MRLSSKVLAKEREALGMTAIIGLVPRLPRPEGDPGLIRLTRSRRPEGERQRMQSYWHVPVILPLIVWVAGDPVANTLLDDLPEHLVSANAPGWWHASAADALAALHAASQARGGAARSYDLLSESDLDRRAHEAFARRLEIERAFA